MRRLETNIASQHEFYQSCAAHGDIFGATLPPFDAMNAAYTIPELFRADAL